MHHLSRVNNGRIEPLGSFARLESAKDSLSHYESNPPQWVWDEEKGMWVAKDDPYRFYTIDGDGNYGGILARRRE